MVGEKSHLGVSEPLSLAFPTERDQILQTRLEPTLKKYDMYESRDVSLKRQKALQKLEEITKAFVYNVSIQNGMTPEQARSAGGKVMTFGSCRLGVQAANADIDAVCICPKHITRDTFFDGVCEMLKSQPEVTELTAIKESYVPLIKLKFHGIPVDLLCARVPLATIPDNLDLDNNSLLVSMNEKDIRSINGTRVADAILHLVPDAATFRIAVKCVKLWAIRRGIYSNIFGFLGGVAWAIMVARVCQLYPNACASTVVSKVFGIIVNWGWPLPVRLCDDEDGPALSTLQSWNPKRNATDRAHKMPIITPVYPTMCATHNMTNSTFRIVIGECKRAAQIMDKIMVGSKPWEALFESHSFFSNYLHYLQIVISSDDPSRQLRWTGLVESRLRHLLNKLEAIPGLALAHPYVDGFDNTYHCTSFEEVAAAAHGSGKKSDSATTKDGVMIYTRAFYIGLYFKLGPCELILPSSIYISWPISEFKKFVRGWEQYEDQHMSVIVRHLKRLVSTRYLSDFS
ncbi:Poly(A) polymerase central domain-containing protein [Dichotomocladium elegans]|nr:Poly(A) polymerase central domain-containing protein [Dichotomocladium elegans]